MKFKALRNKKYPNQFGTFQYNGYNECEICMASISTLFSENSTIGILKKITHDLFAASQLNHYELIDVEVLTKNELPSKSLEKQVLTDFFDWCKNQPQSIVEFKEDLINKFIDGYK